MTTQPSRRQSRRTPGYTVAALAAASITLAGCDTPGTGPQELGICVDSTGMRVDDSYCGAHPLDWDYIDTAEYPTYVIPAMHTRAVFPRTMIIVHTAPPGRSVSLAVPPSGGSVTNIRTTIIKTGSGSGSTRSTGSSSSSGGNGSTRPTGGSTAVTRGGLGVKNSTSSGSSGSAPRISAGS